MIVATAMTAIGVFICAFWLSGVLPVARETLVTAQRAATTMRDPGLDDHARESASRRASLRLGALFASIVVRTALVMAVSSVPIWLASALGLASVDGVVGILAGWQAGATAVVVAYLFWNRSWRTS